MPDPLAYFLTWTAYGTWLPGDERGLVKRPGQLQEPNYRIELAAQERLAEPPCTLTPRQQAIVETTISEHCEFRKWHLHIARCQTRHVHVVVTAPAHPKTVMNQLKAWCSRRLNENTIKPRKEWWTERGSRRFINTEDDLEAVILYVRDCQ
jgi:REP element-mobilizing transposase RayT